MLERVVQPGGPSLDELVEPPAARIGARQDPAGRGHRLDELAAGEHQRRVHLVGEAREPLGELDHLGLDPGAEPHHRGGEQEREAEVEAGDPDGAAEAEALHPGDDRVEQVGDGRGEDERDHQPPEEVGEGEDADGRQPHVPRAAVPVRGPGAGHGAPSTPGGVAVRTYIASRWRRFRSVTCAIRGWPAISWSKSLL